MAVPFMSLYVTQYLKRPPSDAGLIIALFGIGSVAGATTGGWLTDKIGFRPVQIFSTIISGSFFLLFATITHFATLCSLAVVISFFSEAFRPANFTAIASYARPGTETRSYSLNRLATNMGWAVGTSMGGIIASFNYQLLFIVDGSISIIAGISIWRLLPPVQAVVKKAAGEVQDFVARKPWQDQGFIIFLVITTFFATCFFLMFRVGPLFFKEAWHMNEAVIGMVLGLNGVLVALFEMITVNRLENSGVAPFRLIAIGTLVIGSSFLLLISPASLAIPAAILSITLFTIGEMLAIPFINTFVANRSTSGTRGQYAAGYTLSWSFAQVAGPAGGFFLAEHWGYGWLWASLCVILPLCAYSYKMLAKRL